MKKEYKNKRLLKLIPIVETQLERDIRECGAEKSRPLKTWMDIINRGLNGSQDKIQNASEMASIFKKMGGYFNIQKKHHHLLCGDDFEENMRKSLMFYKIVKL